MTTYKAANNHCFLTQHYITSPLHLLSHAIFTKRSWCNTIDEFLRTHHNMVCAFFSQHPQKAIKSSQNKKNSNKRIFYIQPQYHLNCLQFKASQPFLTQYFNKNIKNTAPHHLNANIRVAYIFSYIKYFSLNLHPK